MNADLYDSDHLRGVYQSKSGINYSFLFSYEKKFFNPDYVISKKVWMNQNWTLSILYAAIYIVAIFLGQLYMKSREKYDLRRCLIAWNLVLALFSIAGSVRLWPEFFMALKNQGVEHTICSVDYTHGVGGCWVSFYKIKSSIKKKLDDKILRIVA
jgi:hypothetical protein